MRWILLMTGLLLSSCSDENLNTDEGKIATDQRQVAIPPVSPPAQDNPPANDGVDDDDSDESPPQINDLRWYPQNKWKEAWSVALLEKIDDLNLSEFIPDDRDLLALDCYGYKKATAKERSHFWLVLMASIASQESTFNPRLRFWEAPLGEWSEGLMQLSISNSAHGRECILNSETILEPKMNLICGARILKNQLNGGTRGQYPENRIFPQSPYYWSVLTKPKKKLQVIQFFKGHKKELSFCG